MSDSMHRIEMIDTEINVLRSLYQSGNQSEGQRSQMIKYTTNLIRERKALEEELGHTVPQRKECTNGGM